MSDPTPFPSSVPELLRHYGLRPKKRLGQHFLIDRSSLLKVVQAAKLDGEQEVLEIGAGLGSLTVLLAQTAPRVVAVELDPDLIPLLQGVLSPYPNVRLVKGDILQLDPAELFPVESRPYSVVANIPYYITSAILRHLLESKRQPQRMVLTLQLEVAQRICAASGEMSLLALSVHLYGTPTLVARIPAGAFYPAPKVDSAVVRLEIAEQPRLADTDLFFRLAKAGFSQKRKTLRNALAAGLGLPAVQVAQLLDAAHIDPRRRAETLDLEEWGRLVESFKTCLGVASAPEEQERTPPSAPADRGDLRKPFGG
ncbi:MAG: 16S rRNA (adenine(1518)-N(6)/adenine(1519)-N(6))-dimethyltransferase RsmA [Anaerolineales bacterium]|nr:16S rRNA (adenine(1518)-N(6)/adenine(1519)-N(6))-dimethyltransferase RsmA [Anaerolineales bacterium]MDW8162726.1 16S rRNA (adenine(1518)-N(6)/adenine(1519)-N(6))-dimethyltransferase RsmA [Anaerolineales bacterium]